MGQLPAELLDAVFAQFDVSRDSHDLDRLARLRSNRKSLRTCSLVCRRWTSLAQSHLFRDVAYVLEDDHDDEDLHEDNKSGVRTEFEAIRAFFDTHRDLAVCVRALEIKVSYIIRHQSWFLPVETHHLESSTLCSLLSIMPRVERLDLQDFVLKSSLRPHSQPRFPLKKLKILSLARNTWFSDILYLLSHFADIGFLDLSITPPNDNVPEHSPSAASDLAIHSLAFRGAMCGTICRHLAQSRSAGMLHSLTLTRLLPRDLPQLKALLDATQPTLTRLSLSFSAVAQGEPGNSPLLDLARLLSLQSLELSVTSSMADWLSIWDVLATLSATHNCALQDATLVMRQPGRFSAEDAWTVVPHTLLNATYSTLRTLYEQGSFRRLTYRGQGNGLGRSETEMFPHGMRRYLHSAG